MNELLATVIETVFRKIYIGLQILRAKYSGREDADRYFKSAVFKLKLYFMHRVFRTQSDIIESCPIILSHFHHVIILVEDVLHTR